MAAENLRNILLFRFLLDYVIYMDSVEILISIVLLIALVGTKKLLVLFLGLKSLLIINIVKVAGKVLLMLFIILKRSLTLIKILSIAEFEKLKGLPVLIPDIVHSRQTVQIVNQMQHFFISLVIVERDNGDPVVNLKCKAVHAIVYNDHIFQVSISKYPQILDIIPLLSQKAVLSVKSSLEIFILRVNII